jgi:hypothetical protein
VVWLGRCGYDFDVRGVTEYSQRLYEMSEDISLVLYV